MLHRAKHAPRSPERLITPEHTGSVPVDEESNIMALLQHDRSVVAVKANGSVGNDPLAEIKAQLAASAHRQG
jgi:hypothetical protein